METLASLLCGSRIMQGQADSVDLVRKLLANVRLLWGFKPLTTAIPSQFHVAKAIILSFPPSDEGFYWKEQKHNANNND